METIEKAAKVLSSASKDHSHDGSTEEKKMETSPQPGDTILLTGATGFVAGHILKSLLDAGFKVKATVHSPEKAERLRELYPARENDLQIVVVEDIAKDGAFDDAVKGVTGIVHAAYPHVLAKEGTQELLDQAISGATKILNSTVENGPDVRRVVLTSAFAAMNNQHKGNWPGHTYSEADWNPIKLEEALEATDQTTTHAAAKTLAERACWDLVSRHTPTISLQPARFTLSSILLPTVIGPIAHDLTTTTGSINNSVADIYRLINGCENKVPMNTLWAWADVRDVADAHVAALLAPGKLGGAEDRYFAAAGTYDYNEICKIIERRFPELVREGGTPHAADQGETPYHYKVNNARVKNELGVQLRNLEESIVDTVKSLLDYEDRTRRGETREIMLAPVVTKGKGPERKDANTPYSVGEGKTACHCGGKSGECTCAPESCACETCAKKTEQQVANEKVSMEGEKVAEKTTKAVESEESADKTEELANKTKELADKTKESADKTKEAAEQAQTSPGMKYAKLSGKIDCYCGKGEDNCICPIETCGCNGCARKRAGQAKFEREDLGTRQGGGVSLNEPMGEEMMDA